MNKKFCLCNDWIWQYFLSRFLCSFLIQFLSLFLTMIKINFKFMCNLLMILLKYAENRVRKMWSKFGNWCTMSYWLLYYIQNTFIQSKHSFVIIHEPLSIIQISSVIPIPSVYVVDLTPTLPCTMKLKTYILYLFHIEQYSKIARK